MIHLTLGARDTAKLIEEGDGWQAIIVECPSTRQGFIVAQDSSGVWNVIKKTDMLCKYTYPANFTEIPLRWLIRHTKNPSVFDAAFWKELGQLMKKWFQGLFVHPEEK